LVNEIQQNLKDLMKGYEEIPITSNTTQQELSDEIKTLENRKNELNHRLKLADQIQISPISRTSYKDSSFKADPFDSNKEFSVQQFTQRNSFNNLNSEQQFDDPFQTFDPFNISDNNHSQRVEEKIIKSEEIQRLEMADHFNVFDPFDKQTSNNNHNDTKEVIKLKIN
jgi:hypothetical protein